MEKKAQLLNTGILISLISVVVILTLITLVMSFGAEVNNDIRTDLYEDASSTLTYAVNVSDNGLEGLNTLSEKQNTWSLIIGVGVVITLLLGFLGFIAFKNM